MPIAYMDSRTGQTLVAHLAPGVSPERAAAALKLGPGWREVTEEEAAELQKPAAEELRAARRAEILAGLARLDSERIRPLAELALDPESDFARRKLDELESRAAALRRELAEAAEPPEPAEPEPQTGAAKPQTGAAGPPPEEVAE